MSAPWKSAHLASIRLRSASTSLAPERSACCSELRNSEAVERSAFRRMTRSSFARLNSRSTRFCPARSQATQDFVLPARNAATSSAAAATSVADTSMPAAIKPTLLAIAALPPRPSPCRRAFDRFEGILFRCGGRRKARGRLQPLDDGGVIGAVADRVFGVGPGGEGRLEQRRAGVARPCEAGGERDVAAEEAKLAPGLEVPRHQVALDRLADIAAERVAERDHRGGVEAVALAEPDRLGGGEQARPAQEIGQGAGRLRRLRRRG